MFPARPSARRRRRSRVGILLRLLGSVLVLTSALAAIAAGAPTSVSNASTAGTPDVSSNPTRSLPAKPDYYQSCAISGLDTTPGCLQVALDAIDNARAKEKIGPMRLPADYARLPFDRQMLLVIDSERTDRGLAPIAGITADLDRLAERGAAIDDLPPEPGSRYAGAALDAASGFENALDLDYQWVYDDGPGSRTSGCGGPGGPGCWADRRVVLSRFARGARLVMGAAADPTGDTQPDDKGGPSMALVLAEARHATGPVEYSWTTARAALRGAILAPLPRAPLGTSATGIADPRHTEPPDPDYLDSCAPTGLDLSVTCRTAVLAAIDRARVAEQVKAMVLPVGFDQLSTVEQLFVVIDLERVDRGLPPFVGLTAAMDTNAAKGATRAGDPPDPANVLGDDEEWSGGSVNALDADYGWMYDDGRGSGNIDCPRTGGPGCWDHRHGILDNYGPVGTMVMGAADDPTGDTAAEGWAGGTSMALTLAVQLAPPTSWVLTWAQVIGPRPGCSAQTGPPAC